MKLKGGGIAILFNKNGEGANAIISLREWPSCNRFCDIRIPLKDFIKAIFELDYIPCDIELNHLDRINKKCEDNHIDFEMPDEFPKNKNIAFDIAKRKCPKGWSLSSFISDKSFYKKKNGKNWATVSIERYI